MYVMDKYLLSVEALGVFEQQAKAKGSETTENYKSVIELVTKKIFSPKALQHQKVYLGKSLYKPQESNIHEFIFWVKDMVDYPK